MPTDVVVPFMGPSVKWIKILKWHIADGQSVSLDESLAELETDKANADLPSPAAGVVRHLVQEGAKVTAGQVIARIETRASPGAGTA